MRPVRIAILACALFLSGCVALLTGPAPTREENELRERVAAELAVGDSAAEIEAFYRRAGVGHFGWNDLSERYEGWRESTRSNWAIYLYIYVDDEGHFLRSEVMSLFCCMP